MYKHITEKQRQAAQDLWQQFNTRLADLHMKLYYDCYNGTFFVTFFVTDNSLVPVMDSSSQNPLWFVDYTDYTLQNSEV